MTARTGPLLRFSQTEDQAVMSRLGWTSLFDLSLLLVLVTSQPKSVQEDFLLLNKGGLKALRELPLDKLLSVKKSIADLTQPDEPIQSREDNLHVLAPGFERTEALALRSDDPIKRTGYGSGVKKKPSKVNTIFMLSVTTLAFLAFGGYLLCLIVQSIHAKNDIAGTGETFSLNGGSQILVSSAIRKKKKKPRTERRRRDVWQMDMEYLKDGDKLYNSLITLCEGYVKWETTVAKN